MIIAPYCFFVKEIFGQDGMLRISIKPALGGNVCPLSVKQYKLMSQCRLASKAMRVAASAFVVLHVESVWDLR